MKGLRVGFCVLVNIVITVSVALTFLLLIVIVDPVVKFVNLLGKEQLAKDLTRKTAWLVQSLPRAWGTGYSYNFPDNIGASDGPWSTDKPIVFVSSHHSCFDIVLLTNILGRLLKGRKFSFISRSGLDRYIPLISFYIRQFCFSLPRFTSGDRAEHQRMTYAMLAEFAGAQARSNGAVVIFPEGMKDLNKPEHSAPFRRNGLRILLEQMPDAVLVPVAITGTRDFYTTGRTLSQLFHQLPRFGTHIELSVLPAVEGDTIEEKIDFAEMQVASEYSRLKSRSKDTKAIARRTINWIR